MHFSLFALCILIYNLPFTLSSEGDQSPYYRNCVVKCTVTNCTKDGTAFINGAEHNLDTWSRGMGWGWRCQDECRYECLWKTVDMYMERGYEVPKFHGKWPFKRVLGVQEPASTLGSLLNLAAHTFMWLKIYRDPKFSVKTPLVLFWHIFVLVCVNAWAWSAIFHTRDTPFTEFMDYACALSMVMALFISSVVRVFYYQRKVTAVIMLMTLVYYAEHVRYLYSGAVDYQYNITVNIAVGVTGSLLWVLWSARQLRAGGTACTYVWRIQAFVFLSAAALLLEVSDFPPRAGWDAHALWHLATAPLPLLFYRFVIDDLDYLQREADNKAKTSFKSA